MQVDELLVTEASNGKHFHARSIYYADCTYHSQLCNTFWVSLHKLLLYCVLSYTKLVECVTILSPKLLHTLFIKHNTTHIITITTVDGIADVVEGQG